MADRVIRLWQAAFLTGFVLLVLAAVVIFGLSLVTAAIALSATVLGIINALLAPPGQGGSPQNLIVLRLKRTLNVGPYLKGLTILVWAGTLGMASYAVSKAHRETRLVAIKGVIQTAEGEPADNALVRLETPAGSRTVLAAKGEFNYDRVDPRQFSLGKAVLDIRWKSHQMRREVDLSTETGALLLQFPAVSLPLRVTFFDLRSEDIDYLIQGKASPTLASKINGQPYIIPSNAFGFSKSLFANGNEDDTSFDGNEEESSFTGYEFDYQAFAHLVKGDDWKLLLDGEGYPHLWKPANRQAGRLVSALKKLQADPPDDFAISTFGYGSCDSEDDSVAFLSHEVRQPRFRVAVIENTLQAPVQIGSFFLRENPETRFRDRKADAERLTVMPLRGSRLFTIEILRPGEKLLLPLSLEFELGSKDLLKEDAGQRERFRNKVQRTSSKTYSLDTGGGPVDFERASLLKKLSTAEKGVRFDDYVVGPSLALASLEVNDVTYPLRTPEDGKYVMLEGTDLPSTSCPFLYTFDSGAGTWVKEGHVLYGLSSWQREASDVKRLRRFDGRLLLREEEQEVSFIDLVLVRAISPQGRESTLLARDERLRSADRRYIHLRQGEEVEVLFESSQISPEFTYIAVVRGYYSRAIPGGSSR